MAEIEAFKHEMDCRYSPAPSDIGDENSFYPLQNQIRNPNQNQNVVAPQYKSPISGQHQFIQQQTRQTLPAPHLPLPMQHQPPQLLGNQRVPPSRQDIPQRFLRRLPLMDTVIGNKSNINSNNNNLNIESNKNNISNSSNGSRIMLPSVINSNNNINNNINNNHNLTGGSIASPLPPLSPHITPAVPMMRRLPVITPQGPKPALVLQALDRQLEEQNSKLQRPLVRPQRQLPIVTDHGVVRLRENLSSGSLNNSTNRHHNNNSIRPGATSLQHQLYRERDRDVAGHHRHQHAKQFASMTNSPVPSTALVAPRTIRNLRSEVDCDYYQEIYRRQDDYQSSNSEDRNDDVTDYEDELYHNGTRRYREQIQSDEQVTGGSRSPEELEEENEEQLRREDFEDESDDEVEQVNENNNDNDNRNYNYTDNDGYHFARDHDEVMHDDEEQDIGENYLNNHMIANNNDQIKHNNIQIILPPNLGPSQAVEEAEFYSALATVPEEEDKLSDKDELGGGAVDDNRDFQFQPEQQQQHQQQQQYSMSSSLQDQESLQYSSSNDQYRALDPTTQNMSSSSNTNNNNKKHILLDNSGQNQNFTPPVQPPAEELFGAHLLNYLTRGSTVGGGSDIRKNELFSVDEESQLDTEQRHLVGLPDLSDNDNTIMNNKQTSETANLGTSDPPVSDLDGFNDRYKNNNNDINHEQQTNNHQRYNEQYDLIGQERELDDEDDDDDRIMLSSGEQGVGKMQENAEQEQEDYDEQFRDINHPEDLDRRATNHVHAIDGHSKSMLNGIHQQRTIVDNDNLGDEDELEMDDLEASSRRFDSDLMTRGELGELANEQRRSMLLDQQQHNMHLEQQGDFLVDTSQRQAEIELDEYRDKQNDFIDPRGQQNNERLDYDAEAERLEQLQHEQELEYQREKQEMGDMVADERLMSPDPMLSGGDPMDPRYQHQHQEQNEDQYGERRQQQLLDQQQQLQQQQHQVAVPDQMNSNVPRARIRWITAVNKLISQSSEVSNFVELFLFYLILIFNFIFLDKEFKFSSFPYLCLL